MNAVVIIDKPSGFTSHDVVARARRILGERSIGHLGTLDPMATGILPLVVGSFTRLAQFYTHAEKVYEGAIRFGFSTDTYDAEGDPTSAPQSVTLDATQLHAFAARFRGVFEQTPPPFSAKKIHGVPAYKLARKKKEVVLKPVQVEIKEFELLSIESHRATFRARVASGTYMRSVAHELGQLLGCGAHLESLRRTTVAEFTLADAHTLAAVESSFNMQTNNKDCHSEPARSGGEEPASDDALQQQSSLFIHPRKLLPELPAVTADEATAARIRSGRPVNLPELSRARQVKVFSGQRDLIAIATRVAGTLFHPKIVLVGSETPVHSG
jgi:tRNA pseudouridine55 synthase